MDGPSTKAAPFTAVVRPATEPCASGPTASDAPAVKPGRRKPKPSDASAEVTARPWSDAV